MINNLKGEAKAPENGMAVFAGFHVISHCKWVHCVELTRYSSRC